MDLLDANVLVYSYRTDWPNHAAYRHWLEAMVNGDQSYGMADIVLGGFLRIVTHPRVFNWPTDMTSALEFVGAVRAAIIQEQRKASD